MKQLSGEDRREFIRFPMDLRIDGISVDRAGELHTESAVLKDISGGGAKFTTRHAEWYEPERRLTIMIYLPGINDVWARLKGEATVIRIENRSDMSGRTAEADVALSFNGRLRLIRKEPSGDK